MDEKLWAQNWKLEIPPLMHFGAFEFYCFAAFCMNREQKIGSIHPCTNPPDFTFLWTDHVTWKTQSSHKMLFRFIY